MNAHKKIGFGLTLLLTLAAIFWVMQYGECSIKSRSEGAVSVQKETNMERQNKDFSLNTKILAVMKDPAFAGFGSCHSVYS